MSEADSQNNQPLPESTESMDDSAAALPEAIETQEEAEIMSLLELADSIEDDSIDVADSTDEHIAESETSKTIEKVLLPASASEEDSIALNSDAAQPEDNKEADWFVLTQKMRQRNRRLLDQVTQLQQTLKQKEEDFDYQLRQVRERETLLVQKTEELINVQDQLTRLFHTLEASHQAAQRQQILIETLSEQLQSSQERVAQLERECTLTKQRYNQQSHQLLQAENTCQELRNRLNRQQRQTLQFKSALDKSLEMSTSSQLSGQQLFSTTGKTNLSPLQKAQPIKPWSAEPDWKEDDEVEAIWSNPTAPEFPSAESSPEAEAHNWSDRTEEELSLQVKTNFFSVTSEDNINQDSAGEELPALINSPTEISDWWELPANRTEDDLSAEPEMNREQSEQIVSLSNVLDQTRDDQTESSTATETEEYWQEPPQDESAETKEVLLPQSSWPSPVLYPLRPPKKRKSLAAIELPNFPRNN
ncbi:MAG: hypothetical protein WA919_06805 [Coleofasciculaceae cyanobacterium]